MRREIVELREVVQKLVPLLTGKGLSVTQRGSQAYVQTDPVTKRPKRVNIPNISDNASDSFIRAVSGFIDHEVAHVLITDWNFYGGGASPEELRRPEVQKLMSCHNIIEDTMIEREIVKIFPGSKKNIADLREHFIRKITKPAMKKAKSPEDQFNYLLVVVMRALAGHEEFQEYMDEENHWENPMIKKLIGAFKPETLENLKTAETTEQTLAIAREFYDILYKKAPEPPAPPQQDQKDKDTESKDKSEKEAGEGNGDGERDHSDVDDAEEGKSDDSDQSGESSKEETPDDEEGGNSDQADAEGDTEDTSETTDGSDENEDPDDDADTNENGDDGKESERDEDEDSGGDRGEDESSEDEGSSGSSDELDDESGDEAENEDDGRGNSDAGDDGDDEPDGQQSSDGAEGGEPDGSSDLNDADGQSGGDAKIKSDGGVDESEGHEPDFDANEESDGGSGVGSAEGKSMFEFDEDALEGKDIAQEMMVLISDEAVDAIRQSDWSVFSREWDRIEPLEVPEKMNSKWVPEMEDEVRSMTGRMQKDIERIMASQSHVFNQPGHKKGRLHSPSLYRVSQNDPRVFTQRQEHRSKDTAVTLLVDNSGSMHGSKMHAAMLASYALSTTLDRVSINHEMIGFTTGNWKVSGELKRALQDELNRTRLDFDRVIPLVMPIYKSFDDRLDATVKQRVAYAMNAQRGLRGNIDGECLMIAAERLARQPESRKVMIVLSDGQPAGGYKSGPHLKGTVEYLNNNGIETIGIGIQTDAVKHYYENHVVLHDVADLPGQVMSEIKRLLA